MGLEDGIAMIFFPITFIVHNQKSNGGGWGGGQWGHGVNGAGGMASQPPIVTPLFTGIPFSIYLHLLSVCVCV